MHTRTDFWTQNLICNDAELSFFFQKKLPRNNEILENFSIFLFSRFYYFCKKNFLEEKLFPVKFV